MMKKILKILYVVLALLMLPLSLGITGVVTPPQFGKTYYGVLPKMYRRLQNTEGKRIVVIGGSAVAFGLRGDLIEQEIDGYTVCPFGLYGSIGTRAMMDLSHVNIREGDIVLLAPEQGPQSLSMYFNGDHLWKGIDGNYDMLLQVPYDNVGSMLESFPRYVSQKYEYWSNDSMPDPQGVYSASSFNDDLTMIFDRPYNQMAGGFDAVDRVSYAEDVIAKDFIEYANEYAKFVESKGATLLYAFTPVNALGIQANTGVEDIDAYYNYLDEQFTFGILGSPHDYVMEWGWFYDSNVHVNSAGATVYTKKLVQDLKLYLEDFSQTNIELPEMPLPPEGETGPDGKDALLFNYEETEYGYVITGMKDEAKNLAEIEIPDFYNGKKVYEFAATVFAGNTKIERIYIGKNIKSIKDDSFTGCSKLSGLYMHEEMRPANCTVYKGLFNGTTGCKVYVPQSLVGEYINDYWWSNYGAYITQY